MLSAIYARLSGYLAAIGIAAGILFAAYSKGRTDAASKQAASEAKARDIADQVDNDVGALTPDQRRKGLKSWSRD